MTKHFYFYKYADTYSKKGWSSLGNLKNHLRMRMCGVCTWDKVRAKEDLERARNFLDATTFYEVEPSTLTTTRFFMNLTNNNEWVKYE